MPRLLFTLFTVLCATSALADVTLIRDGQPQVVIIVPDGLYKHLQKPAEQLTSDGVSVPLAAVELADYLGKIGGTRPQIATETQKGIPEGPRIFVGPCKASADLAPKAEEIVVLTRNGHLHLCGGDSGPGGMICKGTLFAVYDLLERDLGVRWLFPGEHGEVVPRQATVTLPELNRREQPRIAKRKVRDVAVSREEICARFAAVGHRARCLENGTRAGGERTVAPAHEAGAAYRDQWRSRLCRMVGKAWQGASRMVRAATRWHAHAGPGA